PMYHQDDAALDILTSIIGRGNNSIFYKNFVKARKAGQVSMFSSTSELAGEISIRVIPFPGQSLADMEKTVRESFAEFEQKGVTDEDLERFKGSAEAQFINSLSSVSGKVSMLAAAETFAGNPNQLQSQLTAIRSVTRDDVMRVYNTYIKGKKAVILSVLPKGKGDMRVAPDNYAISKDGYKAPDYGYGGLKYVKAKDNFDRTQKPGNSANPVVQVPDYWTGTTPNGVKLIGTENNEIPSVSISMSIEGGGLLAAKDPSKAGLTSIVGRMMNEDTRNYSAQDFSAALQKLGSSVFVFGGSDGIGLEVTSLVKNLDKTLALVEERLFHPKFSQEALDRIKRQMMQGFKSAKTQPAVVASTVYNQLLFGKDNVRNIATSGTEQTVQNITLADQAYYDNYFSPSLSSVVVVGDIKESEAKAKLAFLNKWEAKKVDIPAPATGKPVDKTRIYFVDIPKAAQSEIRIGYLTGLPYDATGEYYRTVLMNYILGGAFNSHINLNLREDKGWTYGARSNFSSSKYDGMFTASAGVKASATDSSVVEFIKEIKNYAASGINSDELAFMKSSIGQSDARRYETNGQKAAFLSRILDYNLKASYVQEQTSILKKISEKEIDALAKKYLDLDKMVIVVAGDKETVFAGLQKLGYEVVELDAEGNKKSI
ncbi:MAG TPA: insulinase family protein, partial [Sphingobacteriaceae bacterium]